MIYKFRDTTAIDTSLQTKEGSLVTIENPDEVIDLKSLTVDLEPIQAGSGTPSPTNIRPISGRTEVVTQRTGVNAWDEEWENCLWNEGANGVKQANAYSFGCKNPIRIVGGATYYLHAGNGSFYVLWYDADMNLISYALKLHDSSAQAPSNAVFLTFYSYNSYGTTYNNDISINYPSTDTEYHAYQGTTYTTALGRTVYGGTLDVVSGVLTVTHAIVNLGTLNWNSSAGQFFYTKIGATQTGYNYAGVCSHYPKNGGTKPMDKAWQNNAYVGAGFNLIIKDTRYTDAASFKTAMNGVQLCYELAEPQIYQLTAQQISLLLGDNNIWSNGGNITVTYAIDPTLYQGMPTEAVSINGRFLEKLIDGYRTLYTKGRESLEVELGTYSTGTADGEKIKNHRYPARVLTVGFQLLSSTPEEFRERFNQLNNILSLEEADFIFADETDKFFTGTPIMDASVEAGQMNVTGEWKIYCGYPFKRSVQPITLTSTTDATISGNTATFNFNYKGVMPSKPLLRCEFASAKSGGDYTEDGDCGFVAFLNADESIIQLGNPEVIDVDATNKNEVLINSEFDAFTGWTNSGKTIRSISDPYWNNGAGQTQNYASGVGTLTRNIASTIGFELDMVHRLSVSSPTQTGTFKTLLKNGNTAVVGFSIEKTGSGTAGTVKYIINDKVVGTDAIDLSQYNEHFGYCNRTPVYVAQTYYTQVVTYVKKKKKKKKKKVVSWVANTRWVQSGWNYTQSNLNSGISRDGAVVTFSVGELPDRTFKDSDIATKPCTSISIESTGTFDTNAVRSVALIQKAGVPFAEIPNVFTAGDIVEADCNSANVFLYRKGSMTGHLEPQYGALGNDWEDFEIKVGQNAIRAVWSDWVNTNYKPVIKIIFNEVYI